MDQWFEHQNFMYLGQMNHLLCLSNIIWLFKNNQENPTITENTEITKTPCKNQKKWEYGQCCNKSLLPASVRIIGGILSQQHHSLKTALLYKLTTTTI